MRHYYCVGIQVKVLKLEFQNLPTKSTRKIKAKKITNKETYHNKITSYVIKLFNHRKFRINKWEELANRTSYDTVRVVSYINSWIELSQMSNGGIFNA